MLDIVIFLPGVFCVFFIFLLLERLVHAFLFLIFSISSEEEKKGGIFLSALQLQGAVILYFAQLGNLLLSFFVSVMRILATVSLSYFVLLVVMGVFFVFYEFSPHILRSSMMGWNTIIGPYFYTYFVYPLRYALSFLQGFLALFNAVVFMIQRLVLSFSVTALTQTGNAVIDIGANVGYMFSLIGNSFIDYIQDVQKKLDKCDDLKNVCFEVTELNLVNGLKFIPEITRRIMQLFGSICPILFFPVDMALYPLVDPNLPHALNSLVNLFLNALFEMPRITTQRCKAHKDDIGYIVCLPDIRRLYDEIAHTTRSFAVIFDNWLDMSLVVLESAMAQKSPACAEQQQRNRTFEFSDELFRGNLSTLVSLSASEIAVTDGYTIQYIDTARSMDSVVVPLGYGWPIAVDPSLGLAAVDGLAGTVKKSILGCRCEDLLGRMEITCAIADHFSETTTSAVPRLIDVSFQIPDTDKVMTCATSKISVQSVRWPSVRYTAVNEAPEIVSKRRIDASIWVMPLCLYANFACSKDALVTSCYPYCLALHERASPSNTMVLYDAQQWEEYVHIMGRDCTYTAVENPGVFSVLAQGLMGSSTLSTIVQEGAGAKMYNMRVPEEGYDITCVQSTVARSVVPKTTHASVTYKEQRNSVRTAEQPFVFAGDIALVGHYDFEGNEFSVTAMRISGNSRNEFTMQRIAEGIPANPPVETLDQIGEDVNLFNEVSLSTLRQDGHSTTLAQGFNEQRRVTLPYRFSSSAFGINAAVQTQGRVYYAQNPTLHIWKAFFRYCSFNPPVNQNQIVIFSKYHPLVVHGVNVGFDSVTLASTIEFEDSMTNVIQADMCNDLVALAVTNLEVVDSLNIAATVLYTTISAAQDPFTDNRTRSRIFYINTKTHEKREFRPYDLPIPKQVSNDAVQLCPGLKRMPEIGSFLGETINSVVVIPFMFADIVLQIVGKAPLWRQSTTCPLENYGHTSLQRCGREQFDLFDEFFDTIIDANEYFWRSLIHISNLIPAQGPATDTMKTQLTGIYYMGTSLTPVANRMARPVLNMFSVNYFSLFGRPARSVISAFAGQGIGALFINVVKVPVIWGKYTMHLSTGVFGELIPQIVHGVKLETLHTLWKNLYNSKGEFTNSVIRSSLTVCEGLGMLLDTDTPMAKFLKYQCTGSVYLMEGFFTFVLASTVDTVFIACVCHESKGSSFIPFVKEHCMPHAPEHMQPILLDITNGFRSSEEACPLLTERVRNEIENAMEPSFQGFTAAAEEVGLVFDWLRVWIGQSDGGKCIDFETDPYVAALIPEPVDYFRVCGKTKKCELNCAGVMAAFDKAMEKDGFVHAPQQIERTVEAMYFTSETASSHSNMDFIISVYSSYSPPATTITTNITEDEVKKCSHYVYVLGKGTGVGLSVHVYCIPYAPGMGVYTVNKWDILETASDEKPSMGTFVDKDTVFLINVKDNSPIARLAFRELDPASLTEVVQYHYYPVELPRIGIRRVIRILTKNRYVYMEFLNSEGEEKAVCARLAINKFLREGEFINPRECGEIQNLFTSKHVVWLEESTFSQALLIPFGSSDTEEEIRIVKVNFAYPSQSVFYTSLGLAPRFNWKLGIPSFYSQTNQQNEVKKSERMLAQNSLAGETTKVFKIMSTEDSSAKHDWLKEVRIAPAAGGKAEIVRAPSRQQNMKLNVGRECNRMSCSGCVRRETQIACFAMQQCMVGKCIGTVINQRRPLCAIGMTLKSVLDAGIQAGRGAYLILAQTIALTMEITLNTKSISYQITWPDEAFYDLLCVTKDGLAHGTSIISSIVNVALGETVKLPLGTISSGGRSVDANIKAMFTMISQSFNQLLFQVGLFPLYKAIVIQKVVVCQSNSILAQMSPDGLEVSLGHAELSGGQATCMPDSVDTDAGFIEENEIRDNFFSAGLQTLGEFTTTSALSAIVIAIDMAFAYAKGIVSGMQDVAQTLDFADCKLPDFYMNDVFDCICGDTPMSIPYLRRIEKEVDSAFWCTGTLEMIDTAGAPFIIYNPYSLYEIENYLGEDPDSEGAQGYTRLDKYLLCLSRPDKYELAFGGRDDCEDLRPYLPRLEGQGVDTIAVMGRCRANYQLKEWDPGAYALFTPEYSIVASLDLEVGDCLLNAESIAQGPNACLDEFLSRKGGAELYAQLDSIPKDLYFSYEYSTETNAKYRSVTTDACEVFSGPAAAGHQAMKDCMDPTGANGCRIAPFVWSAKSTNKVPVAVSHKKTGGGDEARHETAKTLLNKAFDDLEMAFETFEDYLNADDQHIVAALFSAEGDFLHQVFDCAFMGAFNKVDMWPLSNQGVTVPGWWRNSDGDRLFQPCTLEKLNGDPNLPFTCGSDMRRAVLKHFVRDFFPMFLTNAAEEGKKQKNMILELLGERIEQLKKAYLFQNISDGGDEIEKEIYYACLCPDGVTRAFSCCKGLDSLHYVPKTIRDAKYDIIPSSNIADQLVAALHQYWDTTLRSDDIDPWWKYLHQDFKEKLYWESLPDISQVVAMNGLFSSTDGILFFNETDVVGPFRQGNESLWHTCTGLLGQKMTTLPLKANETGFFPREVDALSYDSNQGDLRKFSRAILREVDVESPLAALRDWRHAPSESATCKKTESMRFFDNSNTRELVLQNFRHVPQLQTVVSQLHGKVWEADSFKLNDKTNCFCGWIDYTRTPPNCKIPTAVFEATTLQDQVFTPLQNDDIMREVFTNNVDLTKNCPYLKFSDHWGVLTPSAAKTWHNSRFSAHVVIDADEVIAYGRGGLRIGAWASLVQEEGFALQESDRVKQLLAADGFDLTTSAFCVKNSDRQALPPTDKGLFPIIQVVQESMPVAACSRYVVEAAKYKFLTESLPGPVSISIAAQHFVMEKWEKTCNANLHLLSTCNHMEVLEYVPPIPPSPQAECPFSVSGPFGGYYVSNPGCIVYVQRTDAFYDPCLCRDCSVPFVFQVNANDFISDSCKVWFDVRELSQGWGRSVPEDFVEKLMDRIRDDQAEGPDAFSSNEYCDSFVDWWPESWEHPVGYHVTTPCTPEEAGYRTFDNAFKIKRFEDGTARVQYEPSALRDPDLISGHFGAGGLCRRTTYGFPMFELNDLRMCTRPVGNDRFDPLSGNNFPPGVEGTHDYVCSDSGADIPWHGVESLPGHYRVYGTIPALLEPDRPALFLPKAGTIQDSGTTFYTNPRCYNDVECAGGRCAHGVCFNSDIQCQMHGDCPSEQVCDADGKCVPPTVYITNILENDNTDMELELLAQTCSGEGGFDLRGKSRWGQIKDLLPAHGFCGYHEWYDYKRTFDAHASPLDTLQHRWENSTHFSGKTMREERILHAIPHVCDRNFQYADGYKACQPSTGQTKNIIYYEPVDTGGRVAIMPPPTLDSKKLSFLGIDANEWEKIEKCSNIPQCFSIPFKWNGKILENVFSEEDEFDCGGGMIKDKGKGTCTFDLDVVPFANTLCDPGKRQEAFEVCNSQTEIIDEEKTIMQCALLTKTWDPLDIRMRKSAPIINGMFQVFKAFKKTKTGYNSAAKCIDHLRNNQASKIVDGGLQQSTNLYYAFEHSVYDFPFSWWFMCSYLQNVPIISTGQGNIQCSTWDTMQEEGKAEFWMEDNVYEITQEGHGTCHEYVKTKLEDKTINPNPLFPVTLSTDTWWKIDVGKDQLENMDSIGCMDNKHVSGVNSIDECLQNNNPDILDIDCYRVSDFYVEMNPLCQMTVRDDLQKCAAYNLHNNEFDASIHLRDIKKRPSAKTENWDLFFYDRLESLLTETITSDEFTDKANENKIVSQCEAKRPGDWDTWAAEHAQRIDECKVEYLNYGSRIYTNVKLLNEDHIDDLLESGDFIRIKRQKWVSPQWMRQYGKFRGGVAEEFLLAATTPNFEFSFGNIYCGKTGKVALKLKHLYKTDRRTDNGGSYDWVEYSYQKYFFQIEDDENFFSFEGRVGPVDFVRTKNIEEIEVYPCSTSLGLNTRVCQMIQKGTKLQDKRYDCISDPGNSELTPGIVEEVLYQTSSSGLREPKRALIPKAKCRDNSLENAVYDTDLKIIIRGHSDSFRRQDAFKNDPYTPSDHLTYQGMHPLYNTWSSEDEFTADDYYHDDNWWEGPQNTQGSEMRTITESVQYQRLKDCQENSDDILCKADAFRNNVKKKQNVAGLKNNFFTATPPGNPSEGDWDLEYSTDVFRYRPIQFYEYDLREGTGAMGWVVIDRKEGRLEYTKSFKAYTDTLPECQGDKTHSLYGDFPWQSYNSFNIQNQLDIPVEYNRSVVLRNSDLCECYFSGEDLYERGWGDMDRNMPTPQDTNMAVYALFIDDDEVSSEMCQGKNRCQMCDDDSTECYNNKESEASNKRLFRALLDGMEKGNSLDGGNVMLPKQTQRFEKKDSKIYENIVNERKLGTDGKWSFDPSDNIVHDFFINRNLMDQVRCSTKNSTTIRYDQCNYDERLRNLEEYVKQNYLVHSEHVLGLQQNASGSYSGFDIKRGAILSFRDQTEKDDASHHMNKIKRLGGEKCNRGLQSVLETYCYLGDDGDEVKTLNPWLGGNYNPLEGCDSQRDGFGREIVDGKCDTQTCESQTFANGAPAGLTCFSRDDQVVGTPRISDFATNNLCKQAAEFVTGECTQEFGLLGGGKGAPTPDLYVESNFSCSERTTTFFTPVGVNTLFYDAQIENACLQFAADEMGPHSIWMEMAEKRGEKRLQIKAVQIADASSEAPEKDRWYFLLHDNCREDLKKYDKIYQGKNWTASTPYERIAFWQGKHPRGKPVTPDPSRSVIFHERNGGYLAGCNGANPLQGVQEGFEEVPDEEIWRTVDGVHFCSPSDIQEKCKVTFAASKASIIGAMMFPEDNVGLEARAITQVNAGSFLDWPKRGGVYRDGGTSNHEFIRTMHNDIVSRIAPFQTKASLSKTEVRNRATPGTTLSEGGDCHLGRAMRQDAPDDDVSDCYMVSKNKDEIKFECMFNEKKTFPRERSRTPYEAQGHMKTRRKKCSQCSVPTFETSGDLSEDESSFGVPFKFAPSRRILRGVLDLMREYNTTHALGTETSQQDRSRFVNEDLRAAARDVVQKQKEAGDEALAGFRELFAQPWVFCNDTECTGDIPYDTWVSASPGGRLGECKDKLLQETNNGEDLVVNIEICDIDRRLDETCSLMRSAQQLIFDANCHAAGLCEDDTFVYAPAVYSISNNDFVRMSVRNFYLRHGTIDQVCPNDAHDNVELRRQNDDIKAACASTSMSALQELLDQTRRAAHMIARLFYYYYNVLFSIIRMFFSTHYIQASENVLYWTNKFLEEFSLFIREVFNIVARIIFDETAWGQVLVGIMKAICDTIHTLWVGITWLYCNIIRPIIELFLNFFNLLKNWLQSFLEVAINWIPGVNEDITFLDPVINFFQIIYDKSEEWFCEDGNWTCDFDFGGDDGLIPEGVLELPSRCWADFVPFAGISTALSCSRSDTCVKEALGSELVVCDSCPTQDGETFNDFGCNLITKKCSCKTQPRAVTYCTDNSQCSMDASCLLIDNVFSPQAWGVDLCSYCSAGGMCIFEEPGSIGKCGCPYTLPTIQMCSASSVGQQVYGGLDVLQSCYFSSSPDIASLSTSVVSKDALSLTACTYLNPTKTVCLQVDSIPHVVGYGFVRDSFNGRRLLSSSPPILDFVPPDVRGLATELLEDANWNGTMQPCRSLVEAHREQKELGPVDTYVLQKCVFWRTVANRTGGIPDTLLLSWSDAFDLIYKDPEVILSSIRSMVNITKEVISIWPEGREFLMGLNTFWASHNNSWLDVTKTYIQENAIPRRKMDRNFETYMNISQTHGRQLMEAPRFEEFSDAKVSQENAKTTENLQQVFEANDIPKSLMNLVAEPVRAVSIFRASGFDDFMKTRQYDPVIPNQKYWRDSDNDGNLDWETCPVIAEVFDETKRVTDGLRKYYTNGVYRPKGQWKLEGLTRGLRVAKIQGTLPTWKVSEDKTSWPRDIFKGLVATLESLAGFYTKDFVALFSCTRDTDVFTLCNYGRKMFICDHDAVQTCSKREVSPYIGMLMSGLIVFVASYLLSTVMFPFSTPLLFMIILPFFFTYTYSYSIACIPAIPVCLMEDIIFPIFYFIPRNFGVSDSLQEVPGCWNNTGIPAEKCFKSCAFDAEFNYISYSALYAQMLCEFYGNECNNPDRFMPPEWLHWFIDPDNFRKDLQYKAFAQFQYGKTPINEDPLIAQRFCALYGVLMYVPILILLSSVVLVLLSLPAMISNLALFSLQVVIQILFFTHMSDE